MRNYSHYALAVLMLTAFFTPVLAGEDAIFEVTITNLTPGQIISPPVVVSHDSSFSLFQPGEMASPALAAMAEDAMVDLLISQLMEDPAVNDVEQADDGIGPGGSMTVQIAAGGSARRISVVGMLVTTNDTFFAARGIPVPRGRTSTSVMAPGYDAGSEENNESCDYIPGPPCGNPGQNAGVPEGFIHINNGIQGVGDLDPAGFDWRNPVAQVTVRRAD